MKNLCIGKTAVFQAVGILVLVLIVLNFVPTRPVYAATYTVTKTADSNDGACNADCSLREAIAAAVGNAGDDEITLPAGTYNLTLGQLTINGGGRVTINGSGARTTIINQTGTTRVIDANGTSVGLVLNDLTISGGNTSSLGAGLQTNFGITVVVNRVTFTGNASGASNRGGAINVEGANGTSTTVTVNDSTFIGNSAGNGAAIAVGAGGGGFPTLNVNNSTFSGNNASTQGGAIYIDATVTTGNVNIRNSTFYNNSGPTGPAISRVGAGTTTIQNSIIVGHSGADCNGPSFSSTNDLMDDATCGDATPTAVTNFDTTLQNNGGPTNTHALLAGSNALDSGVNSCPDHNGSPLATDQRGVTRPQNITCDIGSYEYEVLPVFPGANGGNGPGGVGVTDGTSTLELWLRADKGVFSDSNCTNAATNGGTVGCWQDQSGNGLHVTRATVAQRPGYAAANVNNQPSLTFTGSQFLERAYNAGFHPTNFTLYAANSVTGGTDYRTPVGNRNFTQCGYNLYATPGNTWQYWPNGSGGWAQIGNAPVGLNQWTFQTATYDTVNRNAFYKDGTLNATNVFAYVSCATHGSTPDFVIGNIAVNGAYGFIGNQSEVMLFGEELPSVRRILVDNYLSAKYDIALSSNDVYDGDTNGNGDFDLDVAGIGQFGGNQHTQAHGAGMVVVNRSFLNDNGDWLLFGHKTLANAKSSADLPTNGDWTSATSPMRWARHWYIDVTDANTNGGTVDIVFDFSEAGMNGGQPPSGPASNYRLLKRDNPTGQFADIATATAVVGDQVHFQNVDISLLGSNFTLGTLDDENSPTAVTLQSPITTNNNATLPWVALFSMLLMLTATAVWLWLPRRRLVESGN
jgi:CSLREA domain-containing protein